MGTWVQGTGQVQVEERLSANRDCMGAIGSQGEGRGHEGQAPKRGRGHEGQAPKHVHMHAHDRRHGHTHMHVRRAADRCAATCLFWLDGQSRAILEQRVRRICRIGTGHDGTGRDMTGRDMAGSGHDAKEMTGR